jgi:hypothetical protein
MFAWLTLPCVEDVEGNLLVSWFLVATKNGEGVPHHIQKTF